jgi:hypothetical protein
MSFSPYVVRYAPPKGMGQVYQKMDDESIGIGDLPSLPICDMICPHFTKEKPG